MDDSYEKELGTIAEQKQQIEDLKEKLIKANEENKNINNVLESMLAEQDKKTSIITTTYF